MIDHAARELLLRLARVVGAMAQDTDLHDQVFDLVADAEELAAEEGDEDG